ncbi:hypothetical protein SUGI_0348450 [Cryptomeria japonica]|uniref:uncharacterized protein LOC131038997 n=1 Tax=Cryptomeria japonica TaxID=3369 RepID=UPI002408EEED|nr:uncharacterized protein LOC131038997 [Cryptomeria japonica]GLJ19341.1 hypothetical protein SUGI_0348450 [Cryptomeria japonica]
MDYGEMDTVKVEKMKAMKKFKRNRKAKKYLRYALVAASAVVLSWSSVWIPVVLQTTAFYFRFACTLVTSSRFVFIMCNVIILTLAAKSGQLSSPAGGSNPGTPYFYDEYVKSSESRPKYIVNLSQPEEEEEVEKRCISVEPAADPLPLPAEEIKSVVADEVTKDITEPEVASSSHGKFVRSQSDKIGKKPRRKLVRSSTAIENPCLPLENSNSVSSDLAIVEANQDTMDMLKEKCDEFIAKHYKGRNPGRMVNVN